MFIWISFLNLFGCLLSGSMYYVEKLISIHIVFIIIVLIIITVEEILTFLLSFLSVLLELI